MYIVRVMIIKITTDTTAAITIMFFVSSDVFSPSSLFKPLVVEFVEEIFALAVIIDTDFETFVVVVAITLVDLGLVTVVVALVVVDVLGACVVDANRIIGS